MNPNKIQTAFRHPELVIFCSVTLDQLDMLEEGGSSVRKDMFIGCASVFVSCFLNLFAVPRDTFNIALFANATASMTSGIMALFFLWYWRKETGRIKKLCERIRNQPMHVEEEGLVTDRILSEDF